MLSPQFHISLSGRLSFLVLLSLGIIFFTLFIYRQTNPIIARWQKMLLSLLRTLALILILLVLFETVIRRKIVHSRPPVVAIAIDESASMATTDNTGSRKEKILKIINNDILPHLKGKFDTRLFTFSNDLKSVRDIDLDSLHFDGDVTNISKSLEKIKENLSEENLTNILLLTDGNYTAGGNPTRTAEEIGVPIFTIGIGSTDPEPDLAISNMETNPFAYEGESTPIQVSFRNAGFGGITLPLSVKKDKKTLVSQMITLPKSPSEKTFSLSFLPTEEGRQKIDVEIPFQKGERSKKNNIRSFYIDVMKARLKILLLAGSVSPEISFLRRYLSSSDRYDLTVMVSKADGNFYESLNATSQINDADIFILQDFPTMRTAQSVINQIKTKEQNKTSPILLLVGKNTDFNKMKILEAFLPFRSEGRNISERQIYCIPTPAGDDHPIMQAHLENVSPSTTWSQLPPIFLSKSISHLWPNTLTLAKAVTSRMRNELGAEKSQVPLIVIRSNGSQKSAAILGYGLWRWDLLMSGIGEKGELYNQIINNMTRWLELTKNSNLVNLTTDKSQYNFSDPVNIQVQVFNEKRMPMDRADIILKLEHKNLVNDFIANGVGDGKYIATLNPDQPGDYKLLARVEYQGRLVGESKTTFTVGEYSAELADTRMQRALLENIALVSRGQYFSPDSVSNFDKALKTNSQKTVLIKENEIWNNPTILFLIVLLLSTEWFIRKKKGMV